MVVSIALNIDASRSRICAPDNVIHQVTGALRISLAKYFQAGESLKTPLVVSYEVGK